MADEVNAVCSQLADLAAVLELYGHTVQAATCYNAIGKLQDYVEGQNAQS